MTLGCRSEILIEKLAAKFYTTKPELYNPCAVLVHQLQFVACLSPCAVVCGGVRWCAVVCGGVRWCAVVCGGVRWCAVVCGGAAGQVVFVCYFFHQ